MNQILGVFVGRAIGRLGLLLAALTLVAFGGASAAQDVAREVLGPDGEPVKEAKVHLVKRVDEEGESRLVVDKIDMATFKQELDLSGQDKSQVQLIVIEAPGCALGVYERDPWHQGDSPGDAFPTAFQLQEEYWVEGRVMDEAGNMVPDLKLFMGSFGEHHYRLPLILTALREKFAWTQTKTDRDGRFRFKGAIHDGHPRLPVGIIAEGLRDGKPMVGEAVLHFLAGQTFVDESGKHRLEKGDLGPDGHVMRLLPCDEVTGVVTDVTTGKPVEGAVIRIYGQVHGPDPRVKLFDSSNDDRIREFTTDKDGAFRITGVRIQKLAIIHPDYQAGNLVPVQDWRSRKLNKLEIKLPPLVDSEIKFVDAYSDNPVAAPMEIFLEMTPLFAGDGWSFDFDYNRRDCPYLYEIPTVNADSEGIIKCKLPVADGTYRFRMPKRNRDGSRAGEHILSRQFSLAGSIGGM